MKQILAFALSFIFISLAWGAELQLSGHRVLSYESYRATQKGPVLIFLPGIYRGYYQNEKVLLNLRKRRIPYVTLHFAEQPASVSLTGEQTPDFSNIQAQDLAKELVALVKELQIKQPVPVTLSFSAVVSPHLDPKIFPYVIETSPIGKDTDGLPENVASFYEMWRAWLQTVPYLGEFWIRQTENIQMHEYWKPWVEGYSEAFPILKESEYKERAIQGYIALSNASEYFDLRTQNFAKGPARFFILGEKEEPARQAIQNEAIALYNKSMAQSENVVVIPDAGHIVPEDQPEAYIEALLKIRAALNNSQN